MWELSDQDNDTMLSLREFCISLYLMERYREGRPLPTSLPSSIMYDETLLSISGAPSHGYAGWGSGQGIAQVSCILVIFSLSLILYFVISKISVLQGFVQQPVMGPRPVTQTGTRPPVPAPVPHPGSGIGPNQQRNQAPALDDPFASHLGNGHSASSNFQETATDGENVIICIFILITKPKKAFSKLG